MIYSVMIFMAMFIVAQCRFCAYACQSMSKIQLCNKEDPDFISLALVAPIYLCNIFAIIYPYGWWSDRHSTVIACIVTTVASLAVCPLLELIKSKYFIVVYFLWLAVPISCICISTAMNIC